MKTIRTVQQTVERDEELKQKPKYAIGDYMEVYSGSDEGHNFYVKDIRYNHDYRKFEYLNGNFMGGWKFESQIVPA